MRIRRGSRRRSDGGEPSPMDIHTLHTYWMAARQMQKRFEEELVRGDSMREPIKNVFMNHWYGALYIVIEGWRSLRLRDAVIRDLLRRRGLVELLRNYRNGVFHYHRRPWEGPFRGLIANERTVPWIRSLTDEFGRWFLAWYPFVLAPVAEARARFTSVLRARTRAI